MNRKAKAPKRREMKPTDSEVQELWERCGFELKGVAWFYGGHYWGAKLPVIDLNNLFKYAVITEDMDYLPYYRQLFDRWLSLLEDEPDPALALFWAIKEATK